MPKRKNKKTTLWYKRIFNKPWKIFVQLVFVGGAIVTAYSLWDKWKPTESQLADEYKEGDLKPQRLPEDDHSTERSRALPIAPIFIDPPINDTFPKIVGLKLNGKYGPGDMDIVIEIGSTAFFTSRDQLVRGLEVAIPANSNFACGTLKFGLKDDRVYISTEFKDLKKEETVGIIEYNHWKIFNSNRLLFYNDDTRLEVRDKQNLKVFVIAYEFDEKVSTNWIFISGYFIQPENVAVLAFNRDTSKMVQTCIPKTDTDWKTKVWKLAEQIETVFPEKP